MNIRRPPLSEYALFIAAIALIAYAGLSRSLDPPARTFQVGAVVLGAVCFGLGWALQHRRFQGK